MAKEKIEKAFTYHAPNAEQPAMYTTIRDKAKEFALMLDGLMPESREKALALTKLEETVMWANAGIARNS